MFGKPKEDKPKYEPTKQTHLETFWNRVGMAESNGTMSNQDRLQLNFMKVQVMQNEEIIEELKKLNSK